MSDFNLQQHGITVENIVRNPAVPVLYEHAIRGEGTSKIADNGSLVAFSGEKTGRSPLDKHLVRHPDSEDDVWWGPVNSAITQEMFHLNRERARDLLNLLKRLYCIDGFAGWDPKHQIKVRIICSRPYHALFMHDMLIRPTPEQVAEFGEPDYVIYNAGMFPQATYTTGMKSRTTIDLSFADQEVVILGTEYAGEMKKGVFTIMNYLMPKRGVLSMHCSATADPVSDSSSLLFGLSGTGKTTLSADPNRMLIGDDEHCWTDEGIFNIEGGCYAKMIDLSFEREPDIYQALRFGTVLENVVLDEQRHVDYTDDAITQNTRGAYPIEFMKTAKIPCVAGQPTDVIFLTCDAFGVLPPDVLLHQRLHGKSRRDRGRRNGSRGHVLALLRRPVPGLAPDQVRGDARREDPRAGCQRLARQHGLEWRGVWHRGADKAQVHACHDRCHSHRSAGRRANTVGSRVRPGDGHARPQRS